MSERWRLISRFHLFCSCRALCRPWAHFSGSPFCLLPPHLWQSWLLSTQALGSAGPAASHLQVAPCPQDWSLCSPCIVPCLRTHNPGLCASAEGREPAIFWALQANTMGTTSWSPLHIHQTYKCKFCSQCRIVMEAVGFFVCVLVLEMQAVRFPVKSSFTGTFSKQLNISGLLCNH